MGRLTLSTAIAAGQSAAMSASIQSPCSKSLHSPLDSSTNTPVTPYPSTLSLRILVARHAETPMTCARPRVLQGQTECELTSNGIKQAHALAHRLAKEDIDFIYSSDLGRARQTAEIIAKVNKGQILQENGDLRVLYDKRLREQNLGDLSGRDWVEVKSTLRGFGVSFETYLSQAGPPTESTQALKARVEELYVDIVDRHLLSPHGIFLTRSGDAKNQLPLPKNVSSIPQKTLNQCVLLITHGGTINSLIKHLLNDLGFQAPEVLTSRFPRVTALYEIQLDCRAAKWTGTLAKFNCVAHNAGLDALIFNGNTLIRDPEKGRRSKEAALKAKSSQNLVKGIDHSSIQGNVSGINAPTTNSAGTVFSSFFGNHIVSNTTGSVQNTAKKSLGW